MPTTIRMRWRIDFLQPVDGAVFDRLPRDLPQWISMAYANFDNGVIRSHRPVTFLARSEGDGFSLRIRARPGPASSCTDSRQLYRPSVTAAVFYRAAFCTSLGMCGGRT